MRNNIEILGNGGRRRAKLTTHSYNCLSRLAPALTQSPTRKRTTDKGYRQVECLKGDDKDVAGHRLPAVASGQTKTKPSKPLINQLTIMYDLSSGTVKLHCVKGYADGPSSLFIQFKP